MRWVIILLPVSFGVLLLWGGVTGLNYQIALRRHGVRTQGTIVDFKTFRPGRGPEQKTVVVEFSPAGGGTQRFESGWSGTLPDKGTSVGMLYVIDDPSVAALGTSGSISGAVTTTILGLLLLAPLLIAANPQGAMNALAASMRWVALGICGGVGALILVFGASSATKRFLLQASGARAEGTVVRHVPKARGSGELPVIEFTSRDGQTHEFVATTWSAYQVGAHLPVVYDAGKPSVSQVEGFKEFWLDPIVLALFGAFFVTLGVAAFYLLRDVTLPELPFGNFMSVGRPGPGGGGSVSR